MANVLKLSKRPADLLIEKEGKPIEPPLSDLSSDVAAKKKLDQAPESNFVPVPHEILSDNDRRITLAGLVNERRNLGGTAHAEQYIT